MWKGNWSVLIHIDQHKIKETGVGKQDDPLKSSGYFTYHQV
jgi:hypothetical protein